MKEYKTSVLTKEIRPDVDDTFWVDDETQLVHGRLECSDAEGRAITKAQAIEMLRQCQHDETQFGGPQYVVRRTGFCPRCCARRVGSKAGNVEAKARRRYTVSKAGQCPKCFMERSASGACGC